MKENNLVVSQLKQENKKLQKELELQKQYYEILLENINNDLNTLNGMRFIRQNIELIKKIGIFRYIWRLIKFIIKVIFKFFIKIGKRILKLFETPMHKAKLKQILKEHRNMPIMLFYPGYDWEMVMYQRPQHMALHFSQQNILFFYCTQNIIDNVDGFKKINDNLYVTNLYNDLKKILPKYTLYMCANMNGCYTEELKYIMKKNNVLYEYIDDLNPDLTNISPELLKRHNFVLKDKKIPIVTTAQYLYEKAVDIRKSEKNILLSTNGVVYEDFHIVKELPIPEKIKNIVKKKKKIIGYYGALAKWFDYDLICETADRHPEWEIILIGIDYDKSLTKYNYFADYKNVTYIGTVPYKELINYGNCCDVLTIPFLLNEITKSTSPVKVFEYMSMEKPIVTTNLQECRRYKSVLIGKNHEDFISKIEEALQLENDKEYKRTLRNEALANTWQSKVEEILNFIK